MRLQFSQIFGAVGVLAIGIGLVGCESDSGYEIPARTSTAPSVVANEPAASSVPLDFLTTDFAPLNRWMNEPFEVEYRNMTPELVFDQDPIADIKYDTRNLPADAPLFELKTPSMTRREILYRIAEFWNLEMSIEALAGEKPSYVLVTGATMPAETVAPEASTGLGL